MRRWHAWRYLNRCVRNDGDAVPRHLVVIPIRMRSFARHPIKKNKKTKRDRDKFITYFSGLKKKGFDTRWRSNLRMRAKTFMRSTRRRRLSPGAPGIRIRINYTYSHRKHIYSANTVRIMLIPAYTYAHTCISVCAALSESALTS